MLTNELKQHPPRTGLVRNSVAFKAVKERSKRLPPPSPASAE